MYSLYFKSFHHSLKTFNPPSKLFPFLIQTSSSRCRSQLRWCLASHGRTTVSPGGHKPLSFSTAVFWRVSLLRCCFPLVSSVVSWVTVVLVVLRLWIWIFMAGFVSCLVGGWWSLWMFSFFVGRGWLLRGQCCSWRWMFGGCLVLRWDGGGGGWKWWGGVVGELWGDEVRWCCRYVVDVVCKWFLFDTWFSDHFLNLLRFLIHLIGENSNH
jgi:hypothetical protein